MSWSYYCVWFGRRKLAVDPLNKFPWEKTFSQTHTIWAFAKMQFGQGVFFCLMQRYNQNDRSDKWSQSLYERGAKQNLMRVDFRLAGVMDITHPESLDNRHRCWNPVQRDSICNRTISLYGEFESGEIRQHKLDTTVWKSQRLLEAVMTQTRPLSAVNAFNTQQHSATAKVD